MASPMRPGQREPNEFELAILERLAREEPSIGKSLERLRVLSREFTGVGSFTHFVCEESEGALEQQVGLDALINMPGVPNGMGAMLFCKGGKPDCLEVFTYADQWDGVYEGFSFEEFAETA